MPEIISTVMNSIALACMIAHGFILCSMLMQYSFPARYIKISGLCFLLLLLAANVPVYVIYGNPFMFHYFPLTVSLPIIVYFFIVAKHRDIRLLFTLCMVNVFAVGAIIFAVVLDSSLYGNLGIFSFIFLFVTFLALEIFLHKKVRSLYFSMQDIVKKGWGELTAVVLFLLLILYTIMNYPTQIEQNPTVFPIAIAIFFLIPFIYCIMYRILNSQHSIHELHFKKDVLELEKAHMETIISANAETEERIRIERHDLRHRMKSILMMIENKEYDEAENYIRLSVAYLDQNKTVHYCQNPILDAVFATYYSEAEAHGIQLESSLAIPKELPVDAMEFSIVIANALENAIIASQKIPEGTRVIKCKYVNEPHHMCQISNRYNGKIKLDENGRPLSSEQGHGIGTRSILTFCEKYNADLSYKTDGEWFHFRIVL